MKKKPPILVTNQLVDFLEMISKSVKIESMLTTLYDENAAS